VTLFPHDGAGEAIVAGVDEVGRGPLAGPVLAAAVILRPDRPLVGLRDSKKLRPAARATLYEEILGAATVSIGRAEVEEIDAMNILRATLLAMQRAVAGLALRPQVVYVDGNQAPLLDVPVVTIVGGDDSVPVISAASIVAKVVRDREMTALAARYPGYGLEVHKGYATASHLAALARLGPTPIHRRSFAPVRTRIGTPRLPDLFACLPDGTAGCG
jgi:ribonuclease HII